MSGDEPLDERLVEWALAHDDDGGATPPAGDTAGSDEPLAPEFRALSRFCRLLNLADPPADLAADDPPREPVNGRYTRLELLGRGGSGVVYKAWDTELAEYVALKFLRTAALGRIKQEAQILASLRHPHIVTIHDIGTDSADGRPFLRLSWVSGGSLAARLTEFDGRPAKAARLMEQVARAIQHAHANNVHHLDLKPGNILLDGNGNALVADFGIAKLVRPAGDPFTPAAGDGWSPEDTLTFRQGTLPYMAPERFGAGGTAGAAADVWAIGVVLYELLTGRRPFDGHSREEFADAVRTHTPARPRLVNRRIPRDLEQICLKCLAKRPEDRWATAGAVADEIRAAQQRQDGVRRISLAVAASLLVASVGLALGYAWSRSDSRHAPMSTPAHNHDWLTRGPDGKAVAIKRYGGEATEFDQTDDGLSITTTNTASLVELQPPVLADVYTIRATVRPTRLGGSGHLVCGVVFRYVWFDTPGGAQHHLQGLFLSNDPRIDATTAFLEQRSYGQGPPPPNEPPRGARPTIPKERLAEFRQVFAGASAPPTRSGNSRSE